MGNLICPQCGKQITPLLSNIMANKCPECMEPFMYLAAKQERPNVMPRTDPDEEFNKVYSPTAVFGSLTLPELIKLREQYFRLWKYFTGHELRVMRWNMNQLNRLIMTRQGGEFA